MIKDLPVLNRPREKAMYYGVNSLSDFELLAIIIKSGTKEKSAIELSQMLIEKYKGLVNVFEASYHDLIKNKGIDKVKAIEIKTVYELSKKIKENKKEDRIIVNCGEDIYNLYHLKLYNQAQEHFIMLLLNSKNMIIKECLMGIGTTNSINVDRRLVCKMALECNASKVILLHNHPSGDSTPSNNDVFSTDEIIIALEMINIRMLDHFIIGNHEYYSILENRKFEM